MSTKIKNWFDLTSPSPTYFKRYLKVCSDLETAGNPLRETIASFSGGVTTDGATPVFLQGGNQCQGLAQTKMNAYRDIALLIATSNVVTSYSNDTASFTTKLKDQYENFLTEWMIYIGELARIKDKWPSKTKIQNH